MVFTDTYGFACATVTASTGRGLALGADQLHHHIFSKHWYIQLYSVSIAWHVALSLSRWLALCSVSISR
ncbi:uncharacterized protein B0H18DRAFT_989690 [Fomitopsis serialis]|uniref:uncharacterized protein n=1 Tax=Fomitopsis serialis TaxID=139415 RepID=UPI0020087192|nr:uncharacterized protein B0H18DRAFT_989690 [Neoantrodia serialis]KAH9931505.1 hypothetical protein B0H18DRAFT_989690 [Neoantrodia serialis]